MELTDILPQLSSDDGIILLSKDNEEFYINEEAIRNSELLQRHKNCNNKKVPLKYDRTFVEFLALILNNPFNQEPLIKNKIKELQDINNHENKTVAELARELKEFDISLASSVSLMKKHSTESYYHNKQSEEFILASLFGVLYAFYITCLFLLPDRLNKC